MPQLSRTLRQALDRAVTQHDSAVGGLREAVCAYYDALLAGGATTTRIRQLILDLVASVEPPASAGAPSIASRTRRVDEMLAWCVDRP